MKSWKNKFSCFDFREERFFLRKNFAIFFREYSKQARRKNSFFKKKLKRCRKEDNSHKKIDKTFFLKISKFLFEKFFSELFSQILKKIFITKNPSLTSLWPFWRVYHIFLFKQTISILVFLTHKNSFASGHFLSDKILIIQIHLTPSLR